jgi:Kdo2-lipid IVA lauroyltransferase/acyltransferase
MIPYYLALPFIYLLSYLPFWALYGVSDFFCFLVFHVIGYRKKVVIENLTNSFPEKSEKEILELSKKYYQYLCDLTLETFKKITMSKADALKHCKFHNAELLNQLRDQNKSVILLMGHYGNWEWAGSSFTLSTKHQLYVVYKALSNTYFEKLMVKSRTMFGTRLIKVENTLRDIIANKSNPGTYAFIADQTPFPQQAYWTTFLNQDTPLFTGAEKLAKKFNYPVVFVNIVRVRRGYYEIFPELLFENPGDCAENEITELYIRRLEREINKMPETWLWSHRRWKYTRDQALTK